MAASTLFRGRFWTKRGFVGLGARRDAYTATYLALHWMVLDTGLNLVIIYFAAVHIRVPMEHFRTRADQTLYGRTLEG